LIQAISILGKKQSDLLFEKKINVDFFSFAEALVRPGIEKFIADHDMSDAFLF
jgi:hypothetical protein